MSSSHVSYGAGYARHIWLRVPAQLELSLSGAASAQAAPRPRQSAGIELPK